MQGLKGELYLYANPVLRVDTYFKGPTHRSLTDTCECYNLGGVVFPQYSPRPSQPTVLCFLSKGPAQSQFNHPIITN
jgi:hypothetical protein